MLLEQKCLFIWLHVKDANSRKKLERIFNGSSVPVPCSLSRIIFGQVLGELPEYWTLKQ